MWKWQRREKKLQSRKDAIKKSGYDLRVWFAKKFGVKRVNE